MMQILIGKIRLPFLAQFLSASLLDVSAITRAEYLVDESGMMGDTNDYKMVATA
jgi:hypothetical protein